MAKTDSGTTTTIKPERGPKGSGTTVSVNLAEYAGLLDRIREAAQLDDREVSNWLRRRLIALDSDSLLIPATAQKSLFAGK